MKKRAILLLLVFLFCFHPSAMASADEVLKVENNTDITVQAEETVTNILDEFENNSDELQEKVDGIMERHSDNLIVKILKAIMEAISKLLDQIFDAALEAINDRGRLQ